MMISWAIELIAQFYEKYLRILCGFCHLSLSVLIMAGFFFPI